MIERIVVAAALMSLGVLAYQVLLSTQRRRVASTAGRGAASRPALLVFTSPTCAPCKLQQIPIVDRLMVDWRDRIGVRMIDVTEQPDTAARFGVWSLPTTIVLDAAGNVSAINQGVASEKKLREQFESASRQADEPLPSASLAHTRGSTGATVGRQAQGSARTQAAIRPTHRPIHPLHRGGRQA